MGATSPDKHVYWDLNGAFDARFLSVGGQKQQAFDRVWPTQTSSAGPHAI